MKKKKAGIPSIKDRSPPRGALHFVAKCENVSFYPDGADVVCADPEDDRTCRLVTQAKSFDSLRMLEQKH